MRTPDPWLTENRRRLSWGALAAGGLGVLVLMVGTRYPWAHGLQAPAAILVAVAVLGWIIVVNRTTPRVADYLAYLKVEVKKGGLREWLAGTDAGFMELWRIKDLEELSHE